jgi:triphosphoribosyl-dephospho-CoA synthetase
MSALDRRAEAVPRAYLEAFRLDVQALKPGNVSVGSPGHGMRAEDFLRSAEASAEQIARRGPTLGERVRLVVAASRRLADCNTNLGIVPLCAPLAQAGRVESLQRFDRLLKRAGINPGTTADITPATLFLERLRDAVARDPGDEHRHTERGRRLLKGGASLISAFMTAGETSSWL